MPDEVRYGLVILVVFLTHVQEGITGFGCTVLALPFVVLLLGLETAVPVLVMLAWVLSVCIVAESWRKIVWSEYGKIVGLAAIGLPVGIWFSHAMPEVILRWILAVFMISIGIHGLWCQAVKEKVVKMNARTRWLVRGFIPLGGVIQGAFGSGGPLVVIYATRVLHDKSVFRVTLCLTWLTLNSILLGQWAVRSMIDVRMLSIVAMCLPFTLLGMFIGNKAHYQVSEVTFRRIVYSVLAASGLALIISLMV